MRDYQLPTVTYGTNFLPIVTLCQLASDEKKLYPEAVQVLENNLYKDDYTHLFLYTRLFTYSVEFVLKLKQNLIDLLKTRGFNSR